MKQGPLLDLQGIHLTGVSIERGDQLVVRDVTATLNSKRVGIIGRNGSGKSSLLRALNGLLPLAAGSLSVHGISHARPKELSRTAGFVFQNPDHQLIFPTAAEELGFGLRQLGADKRSASAQALAYLNDHGCGRFAEEPVHQLSEGQKQLVCILAILIMEPKVLLLDEPFSSLDHVTRRILLNKIDALEQQIIFVSHELDALSTFDEVLLIEGGQLKDQGKPADIIAGYLEGELEEAARRSLLAEAL
ncbi:ABC transporter ATP-binding protein [Pseudovibrio exalbescens]|uniref:energy-coupling factor ABC transporter ATP-binding protein n=1 Tax=Pseudovibrio exalbescens TaxID=197461 RepID=UPI002366B767|nr:ABC transporter ATP-binding protein [Pseudovibrio exalbescens]MDD7911701.1 ABC transporter ATP-binding protein [Pseudovibrio exalbescens]